MFKKLMILVAALSVLSACNGNSKKGGNSNKPNVEAQGQEDTVVDEVQVEEMDPQAKADAEIKEKMLANEWCLTTELTDDVKVTKVISNQARENSEMENSNITISTYSETVEGVELIDQVDGRLTVENNQFTIKTYRDATETTTVETTQKSGYATFITDTFGDKVIKNMLLGGYAKPSLNYKTGDFYYECDSSEVLGQEDQVVEEKGAE